MSIEFRDPAGMFRAPNYAHVGIASGRYRLVFISGQVANDAEGKPVGQGDPRAQAERVYLNLRTALEAAGAKPEHIVKWNGYLVGDHDWRAILREARAKHFPNVRPASTHVRVAALIAPEYLFELVAYAIVPD